jgi:DNA-binding MurR/RpiR family transcriptional regulator
VALQFATDLGALRAGVSLLGGSEVRVARELALAPASSVLVVVDLRRYERWVLEAVRTAADAGFVVVALSDGPLSPLAMAADHSFGLSATSPSPFDSHVGTLALLDLIVASVAERCRDTAADRLERVEKAWAARRSLTEH